MAEKEVNKKRTREKQYERCLAVQEKYGSTRLGLMTNQTWFDDPKRLVFLLSRYKFVSKMFAGYENVLEIGCADAFGSRIVSESVDYLTAVDFDPVFIEDAKKNMTDNFQFECRVHDILDGPVEGTFNGVYSLDVIEHIPKSKEDVFVSNVAASLTEDGVLIVGTPSLQSQRYASPPSKKGHINCKDQAELKRLLLKRFRNVFIFSMNDEVVHTGFYPMANYLIALCCYPQKKGIDTQALPNG